MHEELAHRLDEGFVVVGAVGDKIVDAILALGQEERIALGNEVAAVCEPRQPLPAEQQNRLAILVQKLGQETIKATPLRYLLTPQTRKRGYGLTGHGFYPEHGY
jgi:hypothetical protein